MARKALTEAEDTPSVSQSAMVKMTASEPEHPVSSVTSTPTTIVPVASGVTTSKGPESPVDHW